MSLLPQVLTVGGNDLLIPIEAVFTLAGEVAGAIVRLVDEDEAIALGHLPDVLAQIMVLGQRSKGWSAGRGGSVSNTSQAAPAIFPLVGASASVTESSTPPRAVLMRMALFSSGTAVPCQSCPWYPLS